MTSKATSFVSHSGINTKYSFTPWLVWFSWLEHHPVTKGWWVQFLVGAHAAFQVPSQAPSALVWGCEIPGGVQEAATPCFSLTLMFLSHPSSLSSCLSKKQ